MNISPEENLFKYGCTWNKTLGEISHNDYYIYYFSMHYNNAPVYRLVDKNNFTSFDVYKNGTYWVIAGNITTYKILAKSKIYNSLAPRVLPPKDGWTDENFNQMMYSLISKYHIKLALIDKRFSFWNYREGKNVDKKMKVFFRTVLLSFKRYNSTKFIHIPIEMVFHIFSFFRAIDF